MKNLSYWEHHSFLSAIDHLVVGGGIVGLSAGYYLKKRYPGQRVVVVERDVFSAGASTKNAGFACFGSPSELAADFRTMSENEVIEVVGMRYQGLQMLRALLGDKAMDYRPHGGVELFREEDRRSAEYCLSQLDLWNSILEDVIGLRPYAPSSLYLAFGGKSSFHYSISIDGEGNIHTGKMMQSLRSLCARHGVELFSGESIEALDTSAKIPRVKFLGTDVMAERLYVCTNGFARQLMPELDVTAVRNQVMVTSPLKAMIPEGTYHLNEGYVYFRPVEGRLLIGGFRNTDAETETTSDFGITDKIQDQLTGFIREFITNEEFSPDYRWSGILGIGPSKFPIIQRISERVYVGVRMGGMGVAIGNMIGKKLSELSH